MNTQRWMWIAWPSFLMAAVMEVLVFAVVDPQDLHLFGQHVEMSRLGSYTVGLFFFWLITGMSSYLTALLSMTSAEINKCPLMDGGRPVGCPQPGSRVKTGE